VADEMAHSAAEAEPYATVPEDASESEVRHYLANFAKAMRDRAVSGLAPVEQLIRKEVSIYLASNYDPRPLRDITEDVRAVIEGQLTRR
jgi:hypothetical protein